MHTICGNLSYNSNNYITYFCEHNPIRLRGVTVTPLIKRRYFNTINKGCYHNPIKSLTVNDIEIASHYIKTTMSAAR